MMLTENERFCVFHTQNLVIHNTFLHAFTSKPFSILIQAWRCNIIVGLSTLSSHLSRRKCLHFSKHVERQRETIPRILIAEPFKAYFSYNIITIIVIRFQFSNIIVCFWSSHHLHHPHQVTLIHEALLKLKMIGKSPFYTLLRLVFLKPIGIDNIGYSDSADWWRRYCTVHSIVTSLLACHVRLQLNTCNSSFIHSLMLLL